MYLQSKQFKKLIIPLCLLLTVGCLIIGANIVSAETDLGFEYATNLQLGTRDLRAIIISVINIFLGFLGIIAIIVIMYGGFIYMTSAGDPQKIEKAKKILINGAVGLAIILMSWAIVMFLFRLFGYGTGGGGAGETEIVGPGALGGGIIESHYPERNQRDVPRNTMISITFKEAIDYKTIGDSCALVGSVTVCDKLFVNGDGETSIQISNSDAVLDFDAVKVSTNNNKTFVFDPINYLGNPIDNTWYTVSLTDDIKKSDGDNAFPGAIGGVGYYWQFEVGTEVDLIPPRIEEAIPYPDDSYDDYNETAAAQAGGKITVVSKPKTYIAANIGDVAITAGTTDATVSGDYTGDVDDPKITVTINEGGVYATVNWSVLTENNNSNVLITDRAVALGSGITLMINSGYTAGNQWEFKVTAEVKSDFLRIAGVNYKFVDVPSSGNQIEIGGTIDDTAANIADKINRQDDIVAEIDSTVSNQINITAAVAGKTGNSIALIYDSPSEAAALNITPMSGGENADETQTCVGKCDEPRNVVVQINFNEAIDPISATGVYASCQTDNDCDEIGLGNICNNGLCNDGNVDFGFNIINAQVINGNQSVSGDTCADNLDCLSGDCQNNVCVGDYISGIYVQSNAYKTIEFITFDKCGVNSCGDNVYCLPADAEIEIKINAAGLQTCSDSDECTDDLYNQCMFDAYVGANGYDICQEQILTCAVDKDCSKNPYNICNGATCEDADGRQGKNSPQAVGLDDSLFGVNDIARNSLDGNKDSESLGPENYYNENNGNGSGDSYLWSFWVNDKIDLTPPVIEYIFPNINGTINLEDAIEIKFSKLMMGDALKSDSGYDDGKTYLTLTDKSINPVGYWISGKNIDDNLPLDNIADKTQVFINHTPFASSTNYSADVGEGVKDLYQNCFMPAADNGTVVGSSCEARITSDVFCCNGTPTTPTAPVDEFRCP